MGYLCTLPEIVVLEGLMIVCFGVAIFLALRKPGSVPALLCAMGPFVLGSFALCVGMRCILGTLIVLGRDEDIPASVSSLRVVNLPLYLGIALSVIALVVFFKKRRAN